MKFGKRLQGMVMKPVEGNPPRYFYRDATLSSNTPGTQRQEFRIFQQTYLRELRVIRHQKDITTYPDAPISNLVVAIVPGRIRGRYAANMESRQFVAHPQLESVQGWVDALNAQVLPVLNDLWSMDFDVFGGDRYNRADAPGMMTKKFSAIPDVLGSLEPIFCATLFQTDFLNPSVWYGDSTRAKASELRFREFAMGLIPCGPFTLAMINYPTANVFDRKGPVRETHLRPDMIAWLIEYVAALLAQSTYADPSIQNPGNDLERYFQLVGEKRLRPSYGQNKNVNAPAWYSDALGKYMTESTINQPVLPLEAAFNAIRLSGEREPAFLQ